MHMRCRYIHSFCQRLSWFSHHFYQFGARCLQFCQTPKHTDVHTCTRVRLSTCPNRLCESLSLSLSSNRAKDGGQGEVSGCPHHPVVIKARCMLGRIVKLPTETLDMYMCVFLFCRETHTHTGGISQPLSKSEIYRVLSQFGVKYLHLDVYNICSPSWRVQDQLRDQLVFGSCSVWLYRPDLTVLCHII